MKIWNKLQSAMSATLVFLLDGLDLFPSFLGVSWGLFDTTFQESREKNYCSLFWKCKGTHNWLKYFLEEYIISCNPSGIKETILFWYFLTFTIYVHIVKQSKTIFWMKNENIEWKYSSGSSSTHCEARRDWTAKKGHCRSRR